MNKKRRKNAESVADCWQQLQRLTASEGNYAYRGQANAKWEEVESGAFRRLKETNPEVFISYHEKELLEPARMDGHGFKKGRPLHDLELLAKLQHHGAATCLIDFTRNFLVAIWFACRSHKEKNGKIFILDTSDEENFLSLEMEDLEEKLRPILLFEVRKKEKGKDKITSSKEILSYEKPEPSWWHWSPHDLTKRILKQESLFIFGQPKMEKTLLQDIEISHEHKDEILEELKILGITERTLFKDLPGFAESHGHNKSLPLEYGSAEYYLRKGKEALQRDDFEGAIADFNRAIELKPDFARAYNNRGIVNRRLGYYNKAKADYNRAIELKPTFVAIAYYNRGIVNRRLGYYREAKADFSRAIRIKSNFSKAYYSRGQTYALLRDKKRARRDLLKARELAERSGNDRLLGLIDKALSKLDNENNNSS